MKSIVGVVLGSLLGAWTLSAQAQPSRRALLPKALNAPPASSVEPLATDPVLRYVAGSTIKLEQLLGDEDKQLHSADPQPNDHPIRH